MDNKDYQARLTLYKAVREFIKVTFGLSAGILAVAPPETFEDFKRQWPVLLVSLALALWKALENYRKNRTLGPDPKWRWFPSLRGKVGMLLFSIVPIFALTGCATGSVHQIVIRPDGSSVTFKAKGRAFGKALMGENFGDGYVDTWADGSENIGTNGTQRNLSAEEPEFLKAVADAIELLNEGLIVP